MERPISLIKQNNECYEYFFKMFGGHKSFLWTGRQKLLNSNININQYALWTFYNMENVNKLRYINS